MTRARVRGDRRAAVAVPLAGRAGAGVRREQLVLRSPCRAPRRSSRSSGFVTLAWMAMSSFLLIGVLMVCTLRRIAARPSPMATGRYGGRVSTKAQRRARGDRPAPARRGRGARAASGATALVALGRARGRSSWSRSSSRSSASRRRRRQLGQARPRSRPHRSRSTARRCPQLRLRTKSPDPAHRQDHPHAAGHVGLRRRRRSPSDPTGKPQVVRVRRALVPALPGRGAAARRRWRSRACSTASRSPRWPPARTPPYPNYPPSAWLEGRGLAVPVHGRQPAVAPPPTAYGLSAYPTSCW